MPWPQWQTGLAVTLLQVPMWVRLTMDKNQAACSSTLELEQILFLRTRLSRSLPYTVDGHERKCRMIPAGPFMLTGATDSYTKL